MKVVLKDVRIAFCQDLFTPGRFGNDPASKEAYSSTFLINPVSNAESLEVVKNAIRQVAIEKWGPKAEENLKMLKAQNKICLHDGAEKAKHPGFDGNFFIASRSEVAPGVFDKVKNAAGELVRLTERDGKPYAGCYVNASIDIWVQANNYGTRINATLLGVQFSRDGEAFGGSRPSDGDEFSEFASDSTGSAADDLF